MTKPVASSHLDALGTMRRAFCGLQTEITEFRESLCANDMAGMERARELAKMQLDAYFDAMFSASRQDGKAGRHNR